MENGLINSVDLKNFKGFKDFNLKGLKRVNLIGGKNNIGKTALMEAMMLSLGSSSCFDVARHAASLVRRRQHVGLMGGGDDYELDFFYESKSELTIKIDDKFLSLKYLDTLVKTIDEKERSVKYLSAEEFDDAELDLDNFSISYSSGVLISLNGDSIMFPVDRLLDRGMSRRDRKTNINFICSAAAEDRDIAIFYGDLVNSNREDYLNDSLKIFDENILALKQVVTRNRVLLKLQLVNRDKPVLLSSLGEGINRYIAILCAIWASKDGYLFIDEIENGIHYTNYPKLWKLIFEASKLANCQLFISTHSKECIKSFNEENSSELGAYFELYRNNKTKNIVSKIRDREQLDYALTHDGRLRGE